MKSWQKGRPLRTLYHPQDQAQALRQTMPFRIWHRPPQPPTPAFPLKNREPLKVDTVCTNAAGQEKALAKTPSTAGRQRHQKAECEPEKAGEACLDAPQLQPREKTRGLSSPIKGADWPRPPKPLLPHSQPAPAQGTLFLCLQAEAHGA